MQDIAAPGISRRGTGHRRPGRHAAAVRWALMAVPGAALAVVAVGGFGFGWSWTGFQGNQDLWDVLHLLVLPLALTLVPFWYSTTGRLHPVLVAVLGLMAVGFVVTVVGGYALGWSWTGYAGNTLWDWLELLVLPLTVALLPLWLTTHDRLEVEWLAGGLAFLAIVAALAVCGYGFDWTWTGFPGNTLWDWLELCLVPFVVPVVVTWLSARRPRELES
jgi:ABC-type glycerol-3-phosphate transport system permease component